MKLSMTVQQRLAVVNLYMAREPRAFSEQMTAYDVVEKINLSDEERREFITEIPQANGMTRFEFTPVGIAAPDLECELSKAEADDLLAQLRSAKITVRDVGWIRPMKTALETALDKQAK